jgi:hypothetical protein
MGTQIRALLQKLQSVEPCPTPAATQAAVLSLRDAVIKNSRIAFGGYMTDLPVAGEPTSADEIRIPVPELASIGEVSVGYYYRLARTGRAPLSHMGVPMPAARAWLKSRAAKKAKKAAAVQRLRSLYASVIAKEGA